MEKCKKIICPSANNQKNAFVSKTSPLRHADTQAAMQQLTTLFWTGGGASVVYLCLIGTEQLFIDCSALFRRMSTTQSHLVKTSLLVMTSQHRDCIYRWRHRSMLIAMIPTPPAKQFDRLTRRIQHIDLLHTPTYILTF